MPDQPRPARTHPLTACLAMLLCIVTATPAAWSRARAAEFDEAGGSALYLLRQSVTVRRDGKHNRLLKALRHLRDPALEPLFARLSGAEHPALKIHGILGLAELHPDRGLDLNLVAQLEDPAVQAELISAALESDLLSDDAADQLLGWSGLDMGVKLILASRRLEAGGFSDAALLKEALDANRLARRGLAGLMLLQLGDPAGTEALQAINQSDDPQRDPARAMLLETALRHGYNRVAGWAHAIAIEPNVDPTLGLLAMRTAMRFGEPRGSALWRQQFASTRDPAQRNRLALVALQLAPWLDPALFDVLIAEQDALLAQIGRTGRSIAAGARDIPDQVVMLIQQNHPIANDWALSYARHEASDADAQLILLGLVLAFEQGPERGKVKRLDDAVQATQALFELAPAQAGDLLRPVVLGERTDPHLVQAILLGLIRTRGAAAEQALVGLPSFNDPDSRHLALLLRARQGEPLSDRQMQDLALLVQGGGGLQDTLRIQAAWAWLTRTEQTQAALARVMESM